MKLHHNVALLAAAALLLGGCATAVPPVEVTRFHILQ
jgi:PBP1b-binding outer membrane lipoprotein LpoB